MGNSKYAHFKAHEPTASGIAIRFKSTFNIEYDEDANDYVITYKANNKHSHSHAQSKAHKSLSNGHCADQPSLSGMPRSRAQSKRINDSLRHSKKSQKPKRYSSKQQKNEIIPDQCNKHYLCVSLHSSWMDSKLIPDLV